MAENNFRVKIEKLLAIADIAVDGNRDWDIQIHNDDVFARVLSGGSLAFGQAYMDGWWDCKRLDEFFFRVLRARLDERVRCRTWYLAALKARLWNFQKPSRAFRIGRHHYDMGNSLYKHMLDKRMVYSCGFWENADNLDAAQEAKLDLICRKLDLKPGMRLLDIGCGWGGTAKFAAERYQVEVVGITVSEQQAALAKEICRGLPIDIRLQDYRQMDETFDRIVSIGMIEHVGYKNYETYMRTVRRCLKTGGLFLLHTIGGNRTVTRSDPWIERYIFPNSMLPSARQLVSAAEDVFVLEDWHGFGTDYDKTLMQWFHNFQKNWDVLKTDYDNRFYRMWRYYLLSCAGAFRARSIQLWQLVFSPEGILDGYRSPRYIPEPAVDSKPINPAPAIVSGQNA